MKTKPSVYLSLFSTLALVLLIGTMMLFIACGTDQDCTGCTASSPWSKDGASSCYATQADCERAEGGTCVICN